VNDSPEELRGYVNAVGHILWDRDTDSTVVRSIALKIASSIDPDRRFGLAAAAREVPGHDEVKPGTIGATLQNKGIPLPKVPRNEKTDDALERFQRKVESAIQWIEAYQQRATANATLSLNERRDLALKTIAAIDERNGSALMRFAEVQWDSGLSEPHTRDAVEHWHREQVIEISADTEVPYPDESWRFRLTSRGRSWVANGPLPLHKSGGMYFMGDVNMHSHGPGSVQQLGLTNVAQVQQAAIANLAGPIDTIREHLNEYPRAEREEVVEHLALIEEERQRPEPRPSRLSAAFNAILRITKQVGDAVSPVVQSVVAGVVQGLNPN
jgi:hypothetical protein